MIDKSKSAVAEEIRVSWSSAILFMFFVFFFFNFWQLVHERYFVKYQQDAMGRMVVADFNATLIGIVLAVLIGIVVILSLFFRKQIWRFASSMQLGITLIFAVTLGTVLGTLVFQNAAEGDYVAYYGQLFAFIISRLNLQNVFDAWWFLAFEIILAVSMISVTIRTRPWSLGRIGAATVHLGIVAIIIGAFYGTVFHIDAAMFVGEGEQSPYAVKNEFLSRLADYPEILQKLNQNPVSGDPRIDVLAPQNLDLVPEEFKVAIGGDLRLDEFEEVYYEEPYVITLWRQTTRQDIRTMQEERVSRPAVQIEFDDKKPIPLEDDLGILRINNVYKNFNRVQSFVPDENGSSLAKLKIEDLSHDHEEGDGGHAHDREQLISGDSLDKPLRGTANAVLPFAEGMSRFTNPNNAFRLRYTWQKPSAETLQELGVIDNRASYIFMATGEQTEGHVETRMNIGESSKIGDTDYTIEMLEFYHHFNVNLEADGTSTYSNASDYLVNPTAVVRVSGGVLTEPMRLTVPAMGPAPNDSNFQRFRNETGLLVGFFLAPLRDLVIVGETNELLVYERGNLVETVDLSSTSYQPPYTGLNISLLEAIEKGAIQVEYNNDNPDANYAVDIEITNGSDVKTATLELYDESVSQQDINDEPHRFYLPLSEKHFLTFHVRGDYIKDWRSHVTVLNQGEVVADHRIRVNEPLVYNGYFFYQSDWQPKVPYGVQPDKWYTYLRVTQDPGLPLVYLGILMLVAGMFWTFYIGPKFRRSDSDNTTATAEEQ